MTNAVSLPAGLQVFERGWLSANSVLGSGPEGHTLVDSGYCSHADQTVALVSAALQDQPLSVLLNTHLHSDHCGGNAALQAIHPALRTYIPPGHADAVRRWDEAVLTYRATGQDCPRFRVDGLLQPGDTVTVGGLAWNVHAAPGHDTHAVLLFQPEHRLLISGDALWENGFGVVFPELDGESAFQEVADTLDVIETLSPRVVIPGHGRPFGGEGTVVQALSRARSRLDQFVRDPGKHRQYALKVLMKFRLLEWQRVTRDDLRAWGRRTPYLQRQHALHATDQPMDAWLDDLLQSLVASGAAAVDGEWVIDR